MVRKQITAEYYQHVVLPSSSSHQLTTITLADYVTVRQKKKKKANVIFFSVPSESQSLRFPANSSLRMRQPVCITLVLSHQLFNNTFGGSSSTFSEFAPQEFTGDGSYNRKHG